MQQRGSRYFARRVPPQTLGGQKVKIQLFQNMVMFHIKLKEWRMQQHGSKYFARTPPPMPLPWWVRSKFNFLNVDPGWGKTVKIQLFQNMGMLHIKFKGITFSATW